MSELIDTFANRLSKAVTIRNIKPIELSEKTGIDKSKISSYMSGRYKAKQDGIHVLSKVLNVDPAWLMGYDVPMNESKLDILGNPVVSIPLIGTVKAGYDYLAQENWEGTIDLDKKIADTGEFFALKIKGDSMIPAFFEGDIVIIRKQNDCENNQFAVVIINGDEGTLKKVKKTDEGIILQPINPAYGPVMYTNKEIKEKPVIIDGVFQELRRTNIKF